MTENQITTYSAMLSWHATRRAPEPNWYLRQAFLSGLAGEPSIYNSISNAQAAWMAGAHQKACDDQTPSPKSPLPKPEIYATIGGNVYWVEEVESEGRILLTCPLLKTGEIDWGSGGSCDDLPPATAAIAISVLDFLHLHLHLEPTQKHDSNS